MVEADQERGEDREEDENGHEDALDFGVPSELCERGRAVWMRVAADLSKAGRLKPTDREALARYCDLVGQYWHISQTIREEGETLLVPTVAKGADGTSGMMRRRHPLLTEQRAIAQGLKDLEDRFGMSPLARANLVSKLAGGLPGSGDGYLPGFGDDAGDGEEGYDADPGRFN